MIILFFFIRRPVSLQKHCLDQQEQALLCWRVLVACHDFGLNCFWRAMHWLAFGRARLFSDLIIVVVVSALTKTTMPSFIQDDSLETKKKRKETKDSSKPKKQQRTLASFFSKKAAVQKKPPAPPPPPPEPSPAPPLNEKRKAELMRIVVGKQRKTKKVADANKNADEEHELFLTKKSSSLPTPTKPPDTAVSTKEPTEAVETVIVDETLTKESRLAGKSKQRSRSILNHGRGRLLFRGSVSRFPQSF